MKQVQTKFNIDPDNFGEYNFKNGEKYEYIDETSLSPETVIKIVETMENINRMPNNFLNFVYVTYLDYLKTIYQNRLKPNDNTPKSGYTPSNDMDASHKKHQFGLIIKVDENNKKNQQLVLYCHKDPSFYDQFFLQKALKEAKYNRENLVFSLPPSKASKSVKAENFNPKNNNEQIKNNKSTINGLNEINMNNPLSCSKESISSSTVTNNIMPSHEKTTQKKDKKAQNDPNLSTNFFKREIEIDNYIKGNIFECEVCDYLRNKICSIKDNKELPNVFYALRTINDNTDLTYFYNEFDSVFYVENEVVFDNNIFKINCKYENATFENTKRTENSTLLSLKGKNLVFVECKNEGNFYSGFDKLFQKIYDFRNIIDYIFGLKDYSITILYLYNSKFIIRECAFQRFQTSIEEAIRNSEKEGVDKYNIFSFYTYDNVYIYNYYSINNQLNKLKGEYEKLKSEQQAQYEQMKLELSEKLEFERQKNANELQVIKETLKELKKENEELRKDRNNNLADNITTKKG